MVNRGTARFQRAALALAVLHTVGGAWAQAQATLEEVKVEADAVGSGYDIFDTANVTRGNLSLRETPQTVEVIDMESSAIYGNDNLTDVLDGTGGVIVERNSNPGSRNTIRMRGFNASTSDIYVDGVRGSGSARYSTANVDRVEVLKGPASVLYGRSNGGGIINVVSKEANFHAQKSLGLSYGAWADRTGTVDINQVLSNHWALRITGQVHKANSFRRRVHKEGEMLSPSVAYRNGSLQWVGQITHDFMESQPDRGLSWKQYEFANLDKRISIARPTDYSRDRMRVARSDLHYTLAPQWKLRWQASTRQMKVGWYHHYVGSFVDNTNYLVQQAFWTEHYTNKNISNSLTLTGELNTGSIKHKITTALDYHRTRQDGYGGSVPNADRPRWNPVIDLRDPSTWVAAPGVYENYTISYEDTSRVDNVAWLAQDLMELTPTWKLMLSGRFEQHKVSGLKKREPEGKNRFHFKDTYFSPSMGLVWDIHPQHTTYVGISKSFMPPGAKGGRSINVMEQYQDSPEYNRQYEMGLKSDWLDGSLATQVAVYQLSRYNIPYRPDAENEPEIWAISGEERSRGIDFTAIGQINRHWQVRTSLGFMTAKVAKDDSNPEREGRHLSGISNAQGNLYVRYTPNHRFFAETGVTWTSSRYRLNTGARTPFTIDYLPGYARVDASVGWNEGAWRATASISNLLDNGYWSSTLAPGEPRAVRVRLNYSF